MQFHHVDSGCGQSDSTSEGISPTPEFGLFLAIPQKVSCSGLLALQQQSIPLDAAVTVGFRTRVPSGNTQLIDSNKLQKRSNRYSRRSEVHGRYTAPGFLRSHVGNAGWRSL